jgi:hypothetical protein
MNGQGLSRARHRPPPGGMFFISLKRGHSPQINLDSPPDGTTSLLAKKEATLNAALQYHGIAYHWKTLTDALGRALATDWKNASDLAGIPSGGRSAAAKPTVTRDSQNDTSARQSLPAFPGEKAAAGLIPI